MQHAEPTPAAAARTTVCPVEFAIGLDNRLRRALHNPERILAPHVRPGMRVLDVGCGPGLFTIGLAQQVGDAGQVVAVDVQQGMLDKLQHKLQGSALAPRIQLQRCSSDSLGVQGLFDFMLAFYVVHEMPSAAAFFAEAAKLLAPQGTLLVIEPPLHVSRAAFDKTIALAEAAGLQKIGSPPVRVSKTALLRKAAA